MADSAVVLIHSQGNAVGPLREAIQHYLPAMVFLISNPGADKAMLAYEYLESRNEIKLGRAVRNVEHCEMILIEDGVSKDTILQMFEAIDKAKESAASRANGRKMQYYAGIAGGTKPMVIGSALAAINGDITSYYVREERPGNTRDLLFEIDFMNNLMSAVNWLRSHYSVRKNLRYLDEVIRREGTGEKLTALEIAQTLPFTQEATRNAMRLLKSKGLIDYDPDTKPQIYSSTTLGHYILSMFGSSEEEE